MKKKVILFLAGSFALLCLLPFTVIAQEQSGQRDSIYSDILKEKRLLHVVLPSDYKPGSDMKYNVVYVLDGESNTSLWSQVQNFVVQNGFMPQQIIVGIRNSNRQKDLTPTPAGNPSANGGALQFLSFLKNELIPHINKNYPVKGSNMLYGHSLGGLFCVYALLTEPRLFDSYIAADPSLWWDNGYMRKFVEEKLDSNVYTNKSILITARGERGTVEMGITPVDSVFKARTPAGLQWKVAEYPGETHGSIQLKSIYDGLRFIYSGYATVIKFHPMNGRVLRDKPYKVWFFTEGAELRYTTDGTEPVLTSPKTQSEISLPGPAELTVKSFSNGGIFDKIVRGSFKPGEVLRSIPQPRNAKQGGLRYSYYEGQWDSLPDFRKLKPIQTGLADKDFNFTKLPRLINFGCVFEGFLEIKDEGYHVFALDSDDGSKFWLGNQLLINYDGLHGSGNDQSYVIYLQKGFYPIRFEYFQKEGGYDMQIVYVTPDKNIPAPVRIPPDAFYSN